MGVASSLAAGSCSQEQGVTGPESVERTGAVAARSGTGGGRGRGRSSGANIAAAAVGREGRGAGGAVEASGRGARGRGGSSPAGRSGAGGGDAGGIGKRSGKGSNMAGMDAPTSSATSCGDASTGVPVRGSLSGSARSGSVVGRVGASGSEGGAGSGRGSQGAGAGAAEGVAHGSREGASRLAEGENASVQHPVRRETLKCFSTETALVAPDEPQDVSWLEPLEKDPAEVGYGLTAEQLRQPLWLVPPRACPMELSLIHI